jgi:diguanylate cyclase (GGDEF)-like protein
VEGEAKDDHTADMASSRNGVLVQHPFAFTSDLWLVLAVGIPAMAVAIVFPVTLPSMLVSLELVFTFYFVMTLDVTEALWVNFFGELLGALIMIRHTRILIVLLNPTMKVVCLGAGFAVWQAASPALQAAGMSAGLSVAQLLVVSGVYFLANHLILNLVIAMRTWHFNLSSALEAIKWELVVYFVALPLAYIGQLTLPYLQHFNLLLLIVPVAFFTYLLRLFNHLQWSNRVNQACITLSTAKETSTIYQQTFQLAQEMTDSPRAMKLHKIAEGVYQGFDADGNVYDRIRHPMLDEAVKKQDVIAINADAGSTGLFPHWQARSMVLVPLVGKTKVFGIICLGKPNSHGFYKTHQSQLRFLAHQVSIILDRNHVYEELERAAVTNQLTGLYNYHYFNEKLDEAFRDAKAHGEELSLIIFDIDHFKSYNDTYGHVVGDEVLRQVSAIAKEIADEHGLFLARYGGEEFVALAKLTSLEAAAVAEELRRRVEGHQFLYQDRTLKHITISCGIAHVEEHDASTTGELMEKADQALYWGAKEMGRNRVAVFNPEYDQRLFVDSLTGLHTMHYLRQKMPAIIQNESHFPLHFLLVDIRQMRKVNDEYGYEVGNRVLIDASYVLKSVMRTGDLICRYMDDEFLVVMKGIPLHEIEAVSKRIRDGFLSHLFPIVGSTISCDVTVVTMSDVEEASHIFDWLQTARKHLAKGAV